MVITLTTSYQKISTIALTYGEIRTYAKYTSQNKSTNKTTYYIKSTYYIPTQNNVAFSSASASLDGTPKSYGYTTMYKGETTIQEISRTITHNNDGSSPTKTVATSWSASFGGGGSTSADIKMPKIQRLATITNASDFTDEENPYIEFTNPAGFKVEPFINFYDNSNKLMLSIKRTSGSYTSPYNWELTDEERNTIRNTLNGQKSYKANYGLNTYSGTTNIGYSSQSKTISFVNAEPTFTSSLEETDTNVISVLGSSASKLIENASKVKTTIVPTSKKGATIKSVEIIHGTSDVILTNSPYEQVLTALTNIFKVIVTDSRGYVVTNEITKELIDYLPMEISRYSFKRVVPTSSDLYLNATITYMQQIFGATKNTPTLQWKLGVDGDLNTISSSDYSIDTSNNEITINDLLLDNLLPYTKQGKLYLLVNDLLTSDAENQIVPVGIPVFDYGENDMWINGDLILADRNRQNPLNVRELLNQTGDTLPIGAMLPYGNAEAPTNWLICDGSEVSRERYVELFEVIGTSYGEGDGSTTFNLPNKKGRVSVGLDEDDEDFNEIGKKYGEKEHQLTKEELPNINGTVPHIAYGEYKATGDFSITKDLDNNYEGAQGSTKNTWGYRLNVGENQPHNNVQPSEVDNWIIKAFQSAGVIANTSQEVNDSTIDVPSCKAVKEYIARTGGGTGGTADYEYLDNQPRINGVTLIGNKTANQLKLQPAGEYALSTDIPTKTSQLNNDSGYLTEHQDLTSYATKVYVTEQIASAIGSALGGSY